MTKEKSLARFGVLPLPDLPRSQNAESIGPIMNLGSI